MQLRKMGCIPVGIAASGEQAIEMAVQLRPNLVLMDIHLGGPMDGITAAQAIRAQTDIPCIFLSAFDGEGSRARAKLANPAGYLAKPFTDYDFQAVMAAAREELRN